MYLSFRRFLKRNRTQTMIQQFLFDHATKLLRLYDAHLSHKICKKTQQGSIKIWKEHSKLLMIWFAMQSP